MSDDDIYLEIERRSRESRERVNAYLMEIGRPDLARELAERYRLIDNGVDGAQRTWGALSAAQRRVIVAMNEGRYLVRADKHSGTYDAYGEPHAIARICRLPTVRNLCSRELVHVDGPATDPERRIVITERGRFVVGHGAR